MIHLDIQKELDAPEGKMLLQVKGEFTTGSLVTVYGESGVGKTSFLRMLSGLMAPDKGKIIVNNQTWFDSETKINFKPQNRKIGFVFQDYALFPNMTVRQNIEYALDGHAKKTGIEDVIDIFKLGQLMNKFTDKLSGGQKQRVALARAIARKPDLLMLDEPLSALDHQMRINLQDYLLTVHRKFGLTTFLVSHDVGEIFKMSDEVVVLKNGKVDNRGKPFEVFSNRHISGKFQFTGEVINIEKEDIVYIVTVLIGNHMVKIVTETETAKSLRKGEKVLVASKAFNPIIQKI